MEAADPAGGRRTTPGWISAGRTVALLLLAAALAGAMSLDWLPRTLDLDDLGGDFSLWASAWDFPWHELSAPLIAALVALVAGAACPSARPVAALVVSAVLACVASVALRAIAEGQDDLVAGPAIAAAVLALALAVLGRLRARRSELLVTTMAAGLLVLAAQHRFGWAEGSSESVYILRGYGASVYESGGEAWRSASAVGALAGAMSGLGVLAAHAAGVPAARTAGTTTCVAALGLTATGLIAWSSDPDDVLDRLPGALLVLGGLLAMAVALWCLQSPTHDRP